ncbi:DUF4157 domain-containing protein [Chloroflexota bacterium]
MAEHTRANQNKHEDVEQKRQVNQNESQPLFGQVHAWEQGAFPVTETPFQPRMDEHAELLAAIRSDETRSNLLVHLQQTYGNKYVQRLLKPIAVQPKLTVNPPNDVYEQEADRVAEVVTGSIGSQVQRQEEEEEEELMPKLQRQEEEEVRTKSDNSIQKQDEKEKLQTQPTENEPLSVSNDLETRIYSARGDGQSLSENVKKPMEHAFRADFSDVRVHSDSKADTLNQQLSAKAFTTGQDVFFREGEYNHSSDSGKKLIAHELTHIIQQGGSSTPSVGIQLTPLLSGRVVLTLEVAWGNFDDFQRRVEAQTIRDLDVPRRWLPQLILQSNLREVYDSLGQRNPLRSDGRRVEVVVDFNAAGSVGRSTLHFEPGPAGQVTEEGPETVEERPGSGEQTDTEEEGGEVEDLPEAVRSGSTGGPEESMIMEILSSLDTIRDVLGTGASILEIIGVSAAGTASAALGVVGAIAAIPLGLYSLGQASEFAYEMAYRQGYTLAVVDMSEGSDPNDRAWIATLGPGVEWESRGRADAIRYFRELGPQRGVPIFVALRTNMPDPQARVNSVWENVISDLGTSERGRATPHTPQY